MLGEKVKEMEELEERREENEGLVEKVYVAVGKEVKENKANLIWALQNSDRNKKLVIAHVHKPATTINISKKLFPTKLIFIFSQIRLYYIYE